MNSYLFRKVITIMQYWCEHVLRLLCFFKHFISICMQQMTVKAVHGQLQPCKVTMPCTQVYSTVVALVWLPSKDKNCWFEKKLCAVFVTGITFLTVGLGFWSIRLEPKLSSIVFQSTDQHYVLGTNRTQNGFGSRMRPSWKSRGSHDVSVAVSGCEIVKCCRMQVINKKRRSLAKLSPIHTRLPPPNAIKLKQRVKKKNPETM